MRKLMTLSIVILVISGASTSQGAILEVRTDGLGFASIATALDAAVSGDEIRVWPGTWQPGPLVISLDLSLTSTSGAEATILDGQDSYRLLHVTGNSAVTISGFTFENGRSYDGAAIHVDGGSQVTMQASVLRNNVATHTGGAAFVRHSGSVLEFQDCRFLNNYAPVNAGAVGVSLSSRCNFFDCYFYQNSSNTMAGAIANFYNSLMEVQNCVFVDNSGGETGAIRIYTSPAIITNNTFFENTSGLGTIYANSSSYLEISNNIIASDQSGAGIFLIDCPVVNHSCNIYSDNATGAVNDFALDPTESVTNPLFCNPSSLDFSLCSNSVALPVNNSCGLIGATDVECGACGPVAIEESSWGSLKAAFR